MGRRPPGTRDRGYFLSPALLVETTNAMRVNREEIFGPIATVVRVGDAWARRSPRRTTRRSGSRPGYARHRSVRRRGSAMGCRPASSP
ncbi:MAG: aldehyde dehydrogenase family protein [Actinomycetota bacterium]